MYATGKLSSKVCLAVAVLLYSLAHTTIGAQYGYIPKALQEYSSANHDMMLARLRAPIHGKKTVLDIAADLLRVLPVNLSETCANQSAYLLGHLKTKTGWALQMLDALGKPASGFLEGNGAWLGDFDECIGITTDTTDEVSFSGQYCLVSYPVQLLGVTLQVGSCVPSGCSSNDTATLFNTVLQLLRIHNATGITAACHLSDRPYDTGTYVAIFICTIFAVLLVVGTGYDVGKKWYASKRVDSKWEKMDCDNGSVNISSLPNNEKTPLINGKEKHMAESQEQVGTLEKLTLSFSLYSNGRKLLSTEQGDSTLSCVHGIRFLSMCWVILGHTYVFALAIESDPANFSIILRRSYQVIYNASVSVDSFFVLSGLLVTYLLLQQLEKVQGHLKLKEWALVYLHRYIRLTPVYMILLVIWTWLANHFYDGPLWPTSGSLDPLCPKYWWTNLLYINNFIPSKDEGGSGCMGWAWYLANDMQFFLLTPPLAYLLYRKWSIGVGVTSLLVVGSVGAAAGVTMADSLGWAGSAGTPGYFYDYYVKPWCRFMPYGVGVMLGCLIYKRKGKESLPSYVAVLGWMVAAASCLAVIYGPYDAQFGSRAATATLGESAANNSLSRLTWAIGLSWVIFACSTNSGGWINALLSWKPFIPLGRLTYCAYLIHPIIMTVAECASRQTIHFDDITMTFRFLGILVISLSLAFVASLAFEAPVIGVERILIRSEAKK